ncbi:MAG: LysE family translocator, partial [Granulosicoccaceae bacterium]
LLVAKTVALEGKRYAFANVFGFIAAFYCQGLLSLWGVSALVLQSAQLFALFKLAGALYLMWLGVRALRVAIKPLAPAQPLGGKGPDSLRAAFVEGWLTNILNPKTALFYLAAFPQFLTLSTSPWVTALSLISLHAFINGVWFCAMAWVLSGLRSAVARPTLQRSISAFSGLLLIGFGAKLLSVQSR